MSLGITIKKDETITVEHNGEILEIMCIRHNEKTAKLGFTGPKSFVIIIPARDHERIAKLLKNIKQEGNNVNNESTANRIEN